jgi:D-alanyl-D-alanine dipeptidase
MKILFAIVIATFSFSLSAQIKKPEPPLVKVPFTESLQAVVVTTKDWRATKGEARLYERASQAAKWKQRGEAFPVVVGRSGLAWDEILTQDEMSGFKKEGDGASPAGAFPLTFGFGSAVKPEQVTFPYTRLTDQTECVDDVKSHHYNKVVRRDQVGIFDWKSSEKMLEVGEQYALGVFVAYNSYPVAPGQGSCIFLHVWKNANIPTAGCTAMDRRDLERIVTWLEPERNPYLLQFTESVDNGVRKRWNLPKLN